jgi:hypothetical protein
VNDILILGKMSTWSCLSKILNNKFDIEDLDVANIILGMKIYKSSNGLVLSISHYFENFL